MSFSNKIELVILLSFISGCTMTQKDPVDYVNPNIGGIGHLLQPTIPLVHLPNSMMRISRQPKGFQSERISYFPIQIYSHRFGMIGKLMITQDTLNPDPETWASEYDHDFETAKPYYYSVLLEDYDIYTEITTHEHSAHYRFNFQSQKPANLYIQTQNKGLIEIIPNQNIIQGFEVVSGVKVYFRIKSDQAFTNFGTFQNTNQVENQLRIEGDEVGAYIVIKPQNGNPLNLKVGVSYISSEQATTNLDKEIPDWDFENLKQKNRNSWNQALSKIKVEGDSEEQKVVFYTALYRCFERMVNISEDNLYYSSYDNSVHDDEGINFYIDDWVWDTYRALHPLMILINPEEQLKKIVSYIRMYQQSGWIPAFPLLTGDAACMNGNHAAAVIADAYFKGLRDFDLEQAYQGLKRTELETTMLPWRNGPLTELDIFYHENGFYPSPKYGQEEWVKEVHGWEKRQAVSLALAHSYDDWCLSLLAKELGKNDESEFFIKKAQNFKNHFNPAIGFFAPKSADGEWVKPFDPKLSGGIGSREYFAENNAWTYLFDVQHDIEGLIELLGGRGNFILKLDELFTTDLGTWKPSYYAQFPDATGNVGQFAMGNEPSLHIPYLYNYAGVPWKTQKRIRALLDLWFTDSPFGICGDEDGGGLSSFYVFSAMGFYPVTPGTPYYNIGSPLFSKSIIDLGDNKTFTIVSNNCSVQNKYIQSATLNGKRLEDPFFSHHDIINGAVLEFEMGPRPNKKWGSQSTGPYSMSKAQTNKGG
jgi:predicted alpha-1,2-mannosidase